MNQYLLKLVIYLDCINLGRHRRLSVRHVDVCPAGYGYDNYHRNNMMSLEEFDTNGLKAANNYPLVAVNTSEYQKTLSDKSGAYEPPSQCCS